MRRAVRQAIITVQQRVSASEGLRAVKESGGKLVRFKKGLTVQRTDQAVLEQLLSDARASMSKAVSIRIPAGDLEAAKRVAQKRGIGYQTVLKEIIHKGLAKA